MPHERNAWDALLRTPPGRSHLVQIYNDDAILVSAVAHFVGSGLASGGAAVLIATPEHIAAVTSRLGATGVTARASTQGAFIAVDAEECLTQFMRDGMPDRDAFRAVIDRLLTRVRDAGYRDIRLFGEMVDILWRQGDEATVRLERLWNEVLQEYDVALLCAYRVDPVTAEIQRGLLHQISRCHSAAFSETDDLPVKTADEKAEEDRGRRRASAA
jgi:hypothetical protein